MQFRKVKVFNIKQKKGPTYLNSFNEEFFRKILYYYVLSIVDQLGKNIWSKICFDIFFS